MRLIDLKRVIFRVEDYGNQILDIGLERVDDPNDVTFKMSSVSDFTPGTPYTVTLSFSRRGESEVAFSVKRNITVM